MYGKTCFGVVCDDPYGATEVAKKLRLFGARTDNMGKQFIVYWPSVRVTAKKGE